MERDRITISIKTRLLKAIDNLIDGIDIRNRSHAIETLATQALNLKSAGDAIILAGGENASKMVPQIKENLKLLADYGFERVYIALGYLAEEIKDKIGDGEKYGLQIDYLEDGDGSAGAILPLKEDFDQPFYVVNNISLKSIDLDQSISLHSSSRVSATVITNNLTDLSGLYILEPSVFDLIGKGFSMLETDVFPKLMASGNLLIKPTI